jgi:imidazolonepropionase-like amidohydrolase
MLTFQNARLFDGHEMLPGLHNVTLEGNRIRSIGADAQGDVIDIRGKTLMPGLISSHMHADFYKFGIAQSEAGALFGKEMPPGVMMAIAVRTCRVLLESGFTGFVGASCSNDISMLS